MNFLIDHPVILIEIAVVAVVIVLQLMVFGRNNLNIRKLRKIYPKAAALEAKAGEVEGEAPGRTYAVSLLVPNNGYSKLFREIIHNTNAYLKRNRGEADAETLENIAADQDQAIERELERTVDLPLYIGLFCTFLGVIIGLASLVTNKGGIADDTGISYFIGGVMIAMIGSAMGLVLSVAGKIRLKNAARVRDKGRFDYFTFLREHISKPLAETPALSATTEELRGSLAAFHEGFSRYQGEVNGSLKESLELFSGIQNALKRIKDLETGFAQVGKAMEENDRLIGKQVAYIDSYTQKAEAFAGILGKHFEEVNGKLESLSEESVQHLESTKEAAYAKMDAYLRSLQDPEAGKVLVDEIRKDAQDLREQLMALQEQSVKLNRRMLERFEKDDQVTLRMSQQLEAANAQMKQMLMGQESRKESFTNSFAFKVFTVTGSLAFLGAIAAGIAYAIRFI